MGRGLDWVTHRGPFQPLTFCDSVSWSLRAGGAGSCHRDVSKTKLPGPCPPEFDPTPIFPPYTLQGGGCHQVPLKPMAWVCTEDGSSGSPPPLRSLRICPGGTGTGISAHSKHFTWGQPSRAQSSSSAGDFPSPSALLSSGRGGERRLTATSRQAPASALAPNWSTGRQSWDLSQIAAASVPEPPSAGGCMCARGYVRSLSCRINMFSRFFIPGTVIPRKCLESHRNSS